MTLSADSPNVVLAARAVRLGRQHPPRTSGRQAAAAVYVALTTTKTAEAARKALATFGDPTTRADAVALLGRLAEVDSRSDRDLVQEVEPAGEAGPGLHKPPARHMDGPGNRLIHAGAPLAEGGTPAQTTITKE